MDQETITKAILSNLIDRYIDEVAENPARALRQLVDIGARISDGHSQKIFYQMMQEMAWNQESPYYRMFQNLATRVDKEKIKTYGINVGYNAWNSGARNIRLLEMETGFIIPWILPFDRSGCPDRLPFKEVKRLIGEGKNFSIQTVLFEYSGIVDEWEDLTELFKSFPEMTFTLLLNGSEITDLMLDEMTGIHNLMICLNTDDDDWQAAAGRLIQRRCLFSCFRRIRNQKQAEEVLNGEWMEELIPLMPFAAITVMGNEIDPESAEKIRKLMWDARLSQKYPFLPINLISDIQTIGQIISDNSLIIGIGNDGMVFLADKLTYKPCGFSSKMLLLEDILERVKD